MQTVSTSWIVTLSISQFIWKNFLIPIWGDENGYPSSAPMNLSNSFTMCAVHGVM